MSALERLVASVSLLAVLIAGSWLGLMHYGEARYDAGYAAAVAAGKAQHDRDTELARITETDLRAKLAARDADAFKKEQDYATNLDVAQRRVRAGTDRLRCPTASPVQPAAAPGDRPTTIGVAPDGEGPDVMPEAAAAILGDGADVAGLVSRYARLVERFEECRAVNAK
jgi:hypothetical protein